MPMPSVRVSVLFVATASLALLLPACKTTRVAVPRKPRLILQITVDQLRADLPMRYADRLVEGGFRYLWKNGAVYLDAHHAHANTETVVGHATLATGAHPSAHGMIGNTWIERSSGEVRYNIEDPPYRLLTKGAGIDENAEIDPTQRAARTEGRSPASMLVSTFSDELASYTGGRAKIFGVSVKDRGAVTMAGHAGKASWFSKASGDFVTSSYYYDRYPAWVESWNAAQMALAYSGKSWSLMHAKTSYLFGDSDDRPWEVDLAGFGRVFPHAYGSSDSKYYTTLLTLSPAADELTLDFAKALILAEGLGQDDVPDYLSVSFSATDYIGHLFGPSSLESEEQILRLDQMLAELFRFVDEHLGLDNTLIVLSADHGGPDTPGYLKQLKIPAGYVDPETWDKAAAISRVKERFGISGKLITGYEHPYVYLDPEVIRNPELDQEAIEAAVAVEIALFPGVELAVSSRALERDQLPNTPIYDAVRKNFHRNRSGDVYVVFSPHWFINDFDGLVVASTHGSPWAYDTHVPVVFLGEGNVPQRVARRVHTVDVASTLAARLGLKAPSGSSRSVLPEVILR